MQISLHNVIAGAAIIGLTIIIFSLGISHENKVSQQVVAEVATVERPCGETLNEYLLKAHMYLTFNNTCRGGCTEPSLSALAWMEYYKIYSEFQRAQLHKKITGD